MAKTGSSISQSMVAELSKKKKMEKYNERE